MGFTTFSGPLRAGTVREGADRNTGLAVLAQSWDSGDLTGLEEATHDFADVIRLPRGSQIVDIVIDQTTAAGDGTTTVSIGNAAAGAQLSAAVNTSAGGRFRGTATAATQAAWQTSTSGDTKVHVRLVVGDDTLAAGQMVVTVLYVQRARDGAQNPVSA